MLHTDDDDDYDDDYESDDGIKYEQGLSPGAARYPRCVTLRTAIKS